MRQLFQELKRRNVYRVAATYAVVAFVTLQAAELVFPATTLEGVYDVLVVIAFVGFPLALVLAWAFEMTPEGVRRTPASGDPVESTGELAEGEVRPTEPPGSRGRRAVGALVGLGLVAAAVVGGWYLVGGGGESREVTDRSIAVLPFENMGGEESEQFTQGVHDGLLTRLANISDLQVISRTSVMRYEGTDRALPELARELGVQWIVEGAVQQAGGQVQVNAQLIDARTDIHRWAEDYRRELTAEKLFALQGEIAGEIARSLEAELTPEEEERVERQPTADLTAYQLYVQGRRELARRWAGDMEEAVRLFRRAIERDSSFALAWSGLADAAGHRWWGFEGYDTLSVTPAQAARRALELDPNLAEAHASMGLVHYRQREGPAALEALHRAVNLKPSYPEAHNWLGLVYKVLGRRDEGLRHLELASELNPQHQLARHYLYDTYIARGEIERGLESIREQKRRYGGVYLAEPRALYHLGRFEDARAALRDIRARQSDPDELDRDYVPAYLAAVETAQGDTARARELLTELQERDQPPLVLAYAHAAFGDADATLSAFEKIDEWDYVPTVTLRYIAFPEGMGLIRDDPRYDALLREVNVHWGLNPDGSLPGGASSESETDG